MIRINSLGVYLSAAGASLLKRYVGLPGVNITLKTKGLYESKRSNKKSSEST